MFSCSTSPAHRPTPRAGRSLALVRETAGTYQADSPPRRDTVADLAAAVDALLAVAVDDLDEPGLGHELTGVDRQVRRLQARSGELAAATAARHAARARAARPNDTRAPQRAQREAQRETAERLRWTPGATKKAVQTARELATLPVARRAARDGELSTDHARVVADATRHFSGPERDQLEAELVAAAATCNAVELRAAADRAVASRAPASAIREADRRHARRFFKVAKTPEGHVRLSGLLAGLDAETLLTALDAFRTRDLPVAPPRRPEVRSADALVAMARASLDHGVRGTAHGNRPHVTVIVDWTDLVAGRGCGEAPWTGPLTISEVRRLLDDASISRVVTGPDSIPIDTGRATRAVGAGIWKALVARDRHCTFPGCDAPPSWCQAAHLDRRWIDGAGVSVGEVALACHYHHRLLDRQHWRGRIADGKVVWTPPMWDSSGPAVPDASKPRVREGSELPGSATSGPAVPGAPEATRRGGGDPQAGEAAGRGQADSRVASRRADAASASHRADVASAPHQADAASASRRADAAHASSHAAGPAPSAHQTAPAPPSPLHQAEAAGGLRPRPGAQAFIRRVWGLDDPHQSPPGRPPTGGPDPP